MMIQPKKSSAIESRRTPRAPIAGTVRFSVSPKMHEKIQLVRKQATGELLDISTLGIGLRSITFLPRGARINAKLPLSAFQESGRKGNILFVAIVKNCVMTGQSSSENHPLYRMGVEFERIAKRTLPLIEAYVKKHLP